MWNIDLQRKHRVWKVYWVANHIYYSVINSCFSAPSAWMETQSYACFAYAAKREDKLTALCLQLPCISLSEGAIHPSTWMQSDRPYSRQQHWPLATALSQWNTCRAQLIQIWCRFGLSIAPKISEMDWGQAGSSWHSHEALKLSNKSKKNKQWERSFCKSTSKKAF